MTILLTTHLSAEIAMSDNPLLAAMPKLLSKEKFVTASIRNFDFTGVDQELSLDVKLRLIEKMADLYYPLDRSYRLYRKIHRLINLSYETRNPETDIYQKILNQQAVGKSSYLKRTSSIGVSVVGTSGTSKSTTIRAALSMVDQVINHTGKYYEFDGVQVAWISFDCPETKSPKAFIHQLFKAMDTAIGSNYFDQYINEKYLNVAALRQKAKMILLSHNVGLIHIDEMQNMSRASGNDALNMSFIDSFINEVDIPILWSSTPMILQQNSAPFTTLRRLFSGTSFIFKNIERASDEWYSFTEFFNHPKLLPPTMTLDREFFNLVFDLTCGIPAITSILMSHFYEEVVDGEFEHNPIKILKDVHKERMFALDPALTAFRNGRYSEYEDMVDLERLTKNNEILFPKKAARSKKKTAKGEHVIKAGKNDYPNHADPEDLRDYLGHKNLDDIIKGLANDN
jgi:hypothetical protein